MSREHDAAQAQVAKLQSTYLRKLKNHHSTIIPEICQGLSNVCHGQHTVWVANSNVPHAPDVLEGIVFVVQQVRRRVECNQLAPIHII